MESTVIFSGAAFTCDAQEISYYGKQKTKLKIDVRRNFINKDNLWMFIISNLVALKVCLNSLKIESALIYWLKIFTSGV